MKFGQNLPRNQVPEWASSYINYKGLKKLIKSAAKTEQQGNDADLVEFFFSLDRNLEDVDSFYSKKYAEAVRRLRLLHDRYGRMLKEPDGLDKDEVDDLMGALLELRGQLRKLQWYGEVNRRGFVKITKKLDKKVPNSSAQRQYLASKVDPKPFATNNLLTADVKAVNDWLSVLGEAKTFDDAGSVGSMSSMRRGASRAALNLSQAFLDDLEQTVRADNVETLAGKLAEVKHEEERANAAYQQLLLNLLQRAISCKGKQTIVALLPLIDSLEEEDDINKRNCIHRLVISIGRIKTVDTPSTSATYKPSPAEAPNFIVPAEWPMLVPAPCATTEQESAQFLGKQDEMVRLLTFLLDNLEPEHRNALGSRDAYGRLPLHYAAQYGFVVICQEVIKHMQDWGQFDVSHSIDSEDWQDAEGYAPLHLSVIGGHALTAKCLLDAERWKGASDEMRDTRKHIEKSGAVLMLATKSNAVTIVNLLVEAGVDINHTDEQGETSLHIAAHFGHTRCAEILLRGTKDQKADVNIPEKTFGWTPLFVASVDGNLPIVEILIGAGADVDRVDLSGWSAKEHAALRGHLDIAQRIASLSPVPELSTSDTSSPSSSPPQTPALGPQRSNGKRAKVHTEATKTFGHRYLTNQSMILVSLGSMDSRKNFPAVKLEDIPLTDAHSTQLDTALSIVVSASGASGEPTIIDLPVQENISTTPISFMTSHASKVKLLFDIVPTYAGSKDRVVGRGVALLSSIKPNIGSKRISLQGDMSVPVMAASTLDVIGSVNFNFLIITPFQHPNMSLTEDRTYWKSMEDSTMVIGHRGMGKNQAAQRSLQLGENTIESFIAAANLGASYVEFDVQLTKDHVPVIYHDFLVSETGIDAPVHTLTLEQFLHVSEQRTPRHSRPVSPAERKEYKNTGSKRTRSYSVGLPHDSHNTEMSERMKHTRDFKEKGFKGNSRGNAIQAPFTTLEQMFKKLPGHIGFNIEMKYPMLFESEEQEMDAYAVELNSFVDTVLTQVYDLGKNRNIIFSSFNPDICLLLSLKQPSIPVLFLTDAGCTPVGDIRASSLQEAIRFASRWNLLGIVSAAEPLVMCPRLIKAVKSSGLVCVSYGTLNNEPKNVKRQAKEGIDAVIVDSVLAIRQGLTGANLKPRTSSTEGPHLVVTEPLTSDETVSKVSRAVGGLQVQDEETTERPSTANV